MKLVSSYFEPIAWQLFLLSCSSVDSGQGEQYREGEARDCLNHLFSPFLSRWRVLPSYIHLDEAAKIAMGKKGKGGLDSSKAAQKAAKRAKQESKAAKLETKKAAASNQKKGKGKGKTIEEEEDLDALLMSFQEAWQSEHVTTEERVGQAPSRRANATLTACPHGTDLYLFGGEYFDGERATFFPDLFRYTPAPLLPSTSNNAVHADSGTWRCYSSPTQPGPRSAHQMAASAASGGQLWLFGGEFAGARMNSFHHYRDLWVFHITTKQWERIDSKVRPSARSGHRMVCWKHFLVLFGGFQDTGARTTYLSDLWLFDLTEYKWHEVKQNELRKPAARSAFSFLSTPEGVVLHGGFCKRYVKGQRTQGMALEDTWMLTLKLGEDGDLFHSGVIEWQRRRKIGYAPGPRSGCTMSLWGNKSMGVLFGGVVDTERDEEHMESECFNDLYGYQLTGNGRWISLNLKKAKKKTTRRRKKIVVETSDGEEESASEEEEVDDPDDPLKSVPIVRFNTMLAVQRNTLYCYGGIHETSDREYTMDDFYALDLTKMDRFHCFKACPIDSLEWNESASEGEDDDGSSKSGKSRDEESEEEAPEGEEYRVEIVGEDEYDDLDEETIALLAREKEEREALRKRAQMFLGVSKDAHRSEADALSTPLPGESLREFYQRSKSYFANLAHEQSHGQARGKEMRRDGFELAERVYAEYKPMMEEIQRIQREAGLDDDELKAANTRIGGGGGGTTPATGSDSRSRR
jgi:hypothetical protein